MNQKTPQIYCYKPKTALLVGIGKYGSISLAVSIFLTVFWIGLVLLKLNEEKYEHLENLSKVVKYDKQTKTYFVKKQNYRRIEDSILIKCF